MKKLLKFFAGLTGLLITIFGVDLLCIYIIGVPILAKQGSNYYEYKGLLYDTYKCPEYSTPQIKMKGSKFSCAIDTIENNKIYGTITEIHDNYIIIKSTKTTPNTNINDLVHISLTNNPQIIGAANLLVGQNIEVVPEKIAETFPIKVDAKSITIETKN